MTAAPRRGRPGRRAGGPDTRGQILKAAQQVFAERGYDAATMREIAETAGVNPAMLQHYFGGKEQLFVAAVDFPVEPAEIADAIMSAPQRSRGERLARTFFGVWEDPVRRTPLLGLLRSAIAHESAARLIRQFAQRVMVARLSPGLPGPDPEVRVEAAVSHLFGLALMRYVLKVEPLASTPFESLIPLVAPALQHYFDPSEAQD